MRKQGEAVHVERIPKHFGMLAICFSFLFLFNPTVSPIDILPDLIGYILLCSALRAFADLNDDIDTARRYFQYMILVDVLKHMSVLWLFGLSVSTEKNTGILLLGFVFGFIELLLLIPAYFKLFGGMISLAYVHESTSILGRAKENAKYGFAEKARKSTLVFIVLQRVMAVLPEFSNLNTYEYDETGVAVHSLYEYIGLLRAVAVLITLVFGLIWLWRMLSFFGRVRRDVSYLESLKHAYESAVIPRRGLFVARAVRRVRFLLLIGSIFMVDFRLDSVNLLPDAIGIAFMIGAVLVLSRYVRLLRTKLLSLLSVCGALSLIAYVADLLFHRSYSYSAVMRNAQAYDAYVLTLVIGVIAAAAAVLWLLIIGYCARSVIDQHTGFTGTYETENDSVRLKAYRQELKRKWISYYVFGGLAVLAEVCRVLLENPFGFMGFVSIAFSAAFAAVLYRQWSELCDCVETKYMLE